MADCFEKVVGQPMDVGDEAFESSVGLVSSDPANGRKIGTVVVDAAAEDASVLVELTPA